MEHKLTKHSTQNPSEPRKKDINRQKKESKDSENPVLKEAQKSDKK